MIRLSRQSRYFDRMRSYKIFIDNTYYDDIGDGEVKEIYPNIGQHTIYLTIDWCRSNKLAFAEIDNKETELQCGNSMSGFKRLFPFIYITFLKNKYLFIKVKEKVS